MMRNAALAAVLAAAVALNAAAPARAATVRVGPGQTKTIRGDVLWMRLATADRALLAPFALDFKGRQCWAPADVNEEDCTILVSRRLNGRRTLANGSHVAVNVRYTAPLLAHPTCRGGFPVDRQPGGAVTIAASMPKSPPSASAFRQRQTRGCLGQGGCELRSASDGGRR